MQCDYTGLKKCLNLRLIFVLSVLERSIFPISLILYY